MSYKLTGDHVFKRILVFQFALCMLVLTGFSIYGLFFIADGFWFKFFIILFIVLFGTMTYWLFRDALRKDESKIEDTLNNLDGGSDLLGVVILVLVYLLFGLVALILTFLYRLFFDMEERL